MSYPTRDEEAIFHIARVIDDQSLRKLYLDQVCAGDLALRERVEALLSIHEQEQSFLNSAKPEVAPTIDQKPITEAPGQEIGRYKLMEQIGEGGMGTVFVAQQERPIRRKVALKVIKPGMDSKAVIARFEAERQALAMMDHPNIAKVLDAGTTESGRPYFAMELVQGIPITEYCNRNRLSVADRLELFMQVCQAIQHAHQKGIIHRDIKPTNVLVTLHDGKPVPKVIDFGVAKALNTRLTDKTLYTAHFQVLGTLLYMSPEQAEMSGLDIDTRSDVYSLGVLLYELLTGTTPFGQDEFAHAAFDEQRRVIREKEPPRASVRISSLGATATTIAQQRQTDANGLHHTLRGDLDWVLLKALDKDRTRRYESASSFASDIRRYLESEPIEARSPSSGYLMRKYLRRNRVPVLAGSSIVFALCVAVLSLLFYYKTQSDSIALLRKTIHNELNSAALAGDQRRFFAAETEAEIVRLAASDVALAKSVLALNRGAYPEALKLADDAENADDTHSLVQGLNGCVIAIRCVSHFWGGDLDAAEDETRKLLKINEPSPGLESLLCAYALVGNNPQRTLQILDNDGTARRTISGAFVKAQATLLHAVNTRDEDLLLSSIGHLEVSRDLIGNSDATLGWLLDGYASAIVHFQRKGDASTVQRLEATGRVVAGEFEGPSRYAWALWIFAHAIEDPSLAELAANLADKGGDVEFYIAAHGILFPGSREVRTRFNIEKLASESDNLTLLAGSHVVRSSQEWMQGRLKGLLLDESAFVRRHALSVLCLYLEESEIRDLVKELGPQDWEADLDDFWRAHNCVRYFADPTFTAQDLIDACGEHRFALTNAYFSIAMLAIARHDRQAALEAFEECVAEGGFGSTDDVLARAYVYRMKHNPDWMPWIVSGDPISDTSR